MDTSTGSLRSWLAFPAEALVLVAGLLVPAFVVELVLPVLPARGATPDVSTLIAMGAMSRAHLAAGDVFRLVAAGLLHTDVWHLTANVVGLVLAGAVVERSLPARGWFTFAFLVGIASGSLLSCECRLRHELSVGASGGVCAVLSLGLVLAVDAFRTEALRVYALLVLLGPFGLVFLARDAGADSLAHVGGMAAGMTTALLILVLRRLSSPAVMGRATLAARIALTALLGISLPWAMWARYAVTVPWWDF